MCTSTPTWDYDLSLRRKVATILRTLMHYHDAWRSARIGYRRRLYPVFCCQDDSNMWISTWPFGHLRRWLFACCCTGRWPTTPKTRFPVDFHLSLSVSDACMLTRHNTSSVLRLSHLTRCTTRVERALSCSVSIVNIGKTKDAHTQGRRSWRLLLGYAGIRRQTTEGRKWSAASLYLQYDHFGRLSRSLHGLSL